jgi:hypothetical protein
MGDCGRLCARLLPPMRKPVFFGLLLAPCLVAAQIQPQSQAVIGEVQSRDATVRGAVVLGKTGAAIMSGSQVTAGESTAQIALKRGGSMNLCRASSATVTSASNGREMLIALNSGALEVHYFIPSTSDTIVTPDFRLLLTGPGAFDFAIGTSANGGVCVRSLPGNASSLIVNEQFGDGAHQVKPGEQATFRNGKVDDLTPVATDCGCPQPAAEAAEGNKTGLNFPEQQSRTAEAAVAAGLPVPPAPGFVVPPQAEPKPGEIHTQVDAPVVFRADEIPRPAPSVARATLPRAPSGLLPTAEPPRPPQKHSWYQRFGKALASIFSSDSKRKSE